MADIFDDWYSDIPEEHGFSKSTVPEDLRGAYGSWKTQWGLVETPDYDLPGAFLSGQKPTEGHLGSFGLNGKLLKSPTHKTAWKTAFTELYYQLTGIEPVIDEDMTREEAAEIISILRKGQEGIQPMRFER
jgi:hypothetical protein